MLWPQPQSTAKSASPSVRLQVADLRFDGISALQVGDQRRRHAAALTDDQHPCDGDLVTAVAAVDHRVSGLDAGEYLDLFQRGAERMAVIRGAGEAA